MRISQLWIVEELADELVKVEVDGERVLNVPRELFPARLREGDVFRFSSNEKSGKVTATLTPDREFQEKQLERSSEQVAERSDWDKGGDIIL